MTTFLLSIAAGLVLDILFVLLLWKVFLKSFLPAIDEVVQDLARQEARAQCERLDAELHFEIKGVNYRLGELYKAHEATAALVQGMAGLGDPDEPDLLAKGM